MSEDSYEETSKAKEFRSYLEKGNVMKSFSTILLELYKEETKPNHPLKYVKDKLMGECKTDSCLWELKHRISEALTEKKVMISTVEELRIHNAALRMVIEKLTIENVIAPSSTPCVKRHTLASPRSLQSQRSPSSSDSSTGSLPFLQEIRKS